MFGELDDNQIEEVLHRQIVGRIGCHADGITYVVPISYGYDGESIYAHTHDGMKITMMRKNPEVCFQVDEMPEMANWNSVIAWGEFEEITDPQDRTDALKLLLERNLPYIASKTVQLAPNWPFIPTTTDKISGIVFKIKLGKKTGRYERYDVPLQPNS